MRPSQARQWASRAATGRTPCDRTHGVIRWLLVVFLALLLFSGLRPWLEKLGLGKLPGDFRFRFAGREWCVPLTSSVVLSLLAMLIMKLL